MKLIVQADRSPMMCVEADSAQSVRTQLRAAAQAALREHEDVFDFYGTRLHVGDFFNATSAQRVQYMEAVCEKKGLPCPSVVEVNGALYVFATLSILSLETWFAKQVTVVPSLAEAMNPEALKTTLKPEAHAQPSADEVELDSGIKAFLAENGWR
jgi:hypothetical protein